MAENLRPMEPAWRAEARAPLPASSAPMRGALGRDLRVRAALEILTPADRRQVTAALDELTRPLTPREIDDALIATGLSRGDRRRLTLALKGFAIILVAGP